MLIISSLLQTFKNPPLAEILLVGAGGSSGTAQSDYNYSPPAKIGAGGGGGGEVLSKTLYIKPGNTYTCIVASTPSAGSNGSASYISANSITIFSARGGGAGGTGNAGAGGNNIAGGGGGGIFFGAYMGGVGGVSTGGKGYFPASGDYYAHGGGGGGAGGNGNNATQTIEGSGGPGITTSYAKGLSSTYGKGGSGVRWAGSSFTSTGSAGASNTGNGASGQNKRGGSGIIILSYSDQYSPLTNVTGAYTYALRNSRHVYEFLTNGTFMWIPD